MKYKTKEFNKKITEIKFKEEELKKLTEAVEVLNARVSKKRKEIQGKKGLV